MTLYHATPRRGLRRFKSILQDGGSPFAYNVEVQKSNWPTSSWGKVATEYTSTRWGAKRVAKKIRRRHIRRFGED